MWRDNVKSDVFLSNMSRKSMFKTIVLKSVQVCKTNSCYEQKCILKS